MDYLSEYRSKLCTAHEAVECVKSGDWVEYTTNVGYPPTLDKALSERRDELRNVKIRGDLIFGPIHVAECDPTLEHFCVQHLALLWLRAKTLRPGTGIFHADGFQKSRLVLQELS